ncbi:MAG: flavodoxin domain-containing protein [Limnochordia bacterium]|nr:flavodoxin domain-containing protein [Bacillota bacterium]NLL09222.1 flavodoxin [Bacillota bacterium]HBG10337.1 flavodoxin [Bacillota bacterium]
MKTAILYCSQHHGNTKKLLDAIAKQADVTLLEASAHEPADLTGYDLIGFASGIYYSKLHESVVACAEKSLPTGKKIFIVYTYGAWKPDLQNIQKIAAAKEAQILGVYGCRGFSDYGPLKLIGGIGKGRPNAEEIAGAVRFFKGLTAR